MIGYLPRECDYAIRITVYLAGLKTKNQISVSELSSKINISRSYTARIVHSLRKGGILKTSQGIYGGVSLGKDAEMITLFDILKVMDFNSHFNECISDKTVCKFPEVCKVHKFLSEHEDRFIDALKNAKVSEFAFDEVVIDNFKHNKTK